MLRSLLLMASLLCLTSCLDAAADEPADDAKRNTVIAQCGVQEAGGVSHARLEGVPLDAIIVALRCELSDNEGRCTEVEVLRRDLLLGIPTIVIDCAGLLPHDDITVSWI